MRELGKRKMNYFYISVRLFLRREINVSFQYQVFALSDFVSFSFNVIFFAINHNYKGFYYAVRVPCMLFRLSQL